MCMHVYVYAPDILHQMPYLGLILTFSTSNTYAFKTSYLHPLLIHLCCIIPPMHSIIFTISQETEIIGNTALLITAFCIVPMMLLFI